MGLTLPHSSLSVFFLVCFALVSFWWLYTQLRTKNLYPGKCYLLRRLRSLPEFFRHLFDHNIACIMAPRRVWKKKQTPATVISYEKAIYRTKHNIACIFAPQRVWKKKTKWCAGQALNTQDLASQCLAFSKVRAARCCNINYIVCGTRTQLPKTQSEKSITCIVNISVFSPT